MTLTTEALKKSVSERFQKEFKTLPEALVLAPGRVNLIGEYTDFNHGYVLPMAINRYLALALKKRDDDVIQVTSVDFDETITLDIQSLNREDHSFQEYVSGCIWALKDQGYPVHGFNCVIAGNIPVGAGLSSSAALELAVLKAASYSSGFKFNKVDMAKIGQYAENRWVGVNCGIMDQIISSAGVSGHALKINCQDLSLEPCPVPKGTSVIILDTNTRRDLVDTAYNERRDQCFRAAGIMGVEFLGDADETMLENNKPDLSDLEYKRAHHVITENSRVKETAQAMQNQDPVSIGKLMNISHDSLRDKFEVSSPALDAIVGCSQSETACYGARMTGAGFGGCAVALVDDTRKDHFIENVNRCYQEKTGLEPKIYICRPSDGVTLTKL